jgi:hypothetical protein
VLHKEHRPPELSQHLQHTSAYVSIRQRTSVLCCKSIVRQSCRSTCSIRQRTSAYVSIRSIRQHTSVLCCKRKMHKSCRSTCLRGTRVVGRLPHMSQASDAALLILLVQKYKSGGTNTPARGARAQPGAPA